MSALREIFASFGIQMDTAPIDRGNTAVDGLVANLHTAGAAIAANLVFQEVSAFVTSVTAAADSIDKMSLSIGISGAQLQQWRYAAGLAGVGASEMDATFARLQNQMSRPGPGADIFRRLGVAVRGADGELRSAADVMSDLADPLAAMGAGTERTGILMQLLGEQGARLGPLFSQGSEGIARVRAEFEELGGGLSQEAIEAGASLTDAWSRLDVITLSLRSRIAVFLLPVLESVSGVMADLGRSSSSFEAALGTLGVALVALAATSSATWVPMAAATARAVLPLALLWVVMDDVLTLFRGGDSVIGRVMDALGGDGTQLEFVNAMREAWEGLLLTIRDLQAMITVAVGTTGVGRMVAGGEDVRTNVRGIQRDESGAVQGISAAQDRDQMESSRYLNSLVGRGPQTEGVSRGVSTKSVTVTQAPVVNVDARGLSAEAAKAVAEQAVEGAMRRASTDTMDHLGAGGVE